MIMKTLMRNQNCTIYRPDLKSLTKLLFIFLSFLIVTSCSNDDDGDCIPLQVETDEVTSVDAPETAEVNETIEIEVQFTVRNSCGEFSRFIETGTPMNRNIVVEARYEGCACAQVIETITAIYEFTPTEAGEYLLNFRSGTNEFITAEITVTEGS